MRSTVGLDCFHEWCVETAPDSVSRLVTEWRDKIAVIGGDQCGRIQALIADNFIPIQYESGMLRDDECRSREYCSVLVHRDLYSELYEFCADDETFEYIFSDAENEISGGPHDARKKMIVTVDVENRYYVYAYARWPVSTMFTVGETLADTLLNNYIHFQIYTRECGDSQRVLVFLQCFRDRVHK